MDLFVYWARVQSRPCSDALVKRAAELWCAETGNAPFSADIRRPQYEKPRFIHAPDVHFSISHSGAYWMCAIGTAPVGVDLQIHQKADFRGIARRHFHPLEAAWLEKSPDDFFRIWTSKEAWCKYTGQGIDDHFDAFSVAGPDGILTELNGVSLCFPDFRLGYTLAIAVKGATQIHFRPLKAD